MKNTDVYLICFMVFISFTGFSGSFFDKSVNDLTKATLFALQLSETRNLNIVVNFSSTYLIQTVEELTQLSSGTITLNLIDLARANKFSEGSTTLFILEDESQLISSDEIKFSSGKLLILLYNESQIEEKRIFSYFWNFYACNVNIIFVNKENVIQMSTFTPFSSDKCHNMESKIINVYDSNQGKWKNQEIFPNKLRNFHECPLKIWTFEFETGVIAANSTKVYGYEVEIVQSIAQLMNFTPQFNILNEAKAWGFLLENGTSGGVIKKVIDKQADIALGGYYLTRTRAKYMSFCVYNDAKIIIVIPPGRNFSVFEKLFHPFKLNVWIALLVMVIGAVFVIFWIDRQSKRIRDFVFGSKTGNPYLNMLDIILNGSQPVQPKRNFSRVILTLFVIFCLVVRTSYQAALFKFLQIDQRHGELETVDELIEKGFDVYMYESFQELSNGLKIHQRLVELAVSEAITLKNVYGAVFIISAKTSVLTAFLQH